MTQTLPLPWDGRESLRPHFVLRTQYAPALLGLSNKRQHRLRACGLIFCSGSHYVYARRETELAQQLLAIVPRESERAHIGHA